MENGNVYNVLSRNTVLWTGGFCGVRNDTDVK